MPSRIPHAPCKGCTDRHELCHGTCERYIEWRRQREEVIVEILPKYRADCASESFLNGKRSRFRAFGKTGRKR